MKQYYYPRRKAGVVVKIEQRDHLKLLVNLEKDSRKCVKLLHEAYGEAALPKARIYEWQRRFKSGREELEIEPNSESVRR